MNVIFSSKFKTGSLNQEFLKDYPSLTEDERRIVHAFYTSVVNNIPLEGKNKTSWQMDNGQEIPNSGFYKANKLWHYHSGPYQNKSKKVYQATINLKKNLKGKTSKGIIHYQKIDHETIRVVAYSPNHTPFPNSSIAISLLNRHLVE